MEGLYQPIGGWSNIIYHTCKQGSVTSPLGNSLNGPGLSQAGLRRSGPSGAAPVARAKGGKARQLAARSKGSYRDWEPRQGELPRLVKSYWGL